MHHYVILFRATRPLTAEEQQSRLKEIQQWVAKVTALGIQLEPRNLGDTAANLSSVGGETKNHSTPTDPALVTMVFFDCADKQQAVEIARIHPGLHYGVTVELREWTSPAPLPRP